MSSASRAPLFVMGATGRVGGAVLSSLQGKLLIRAASQSGRDPEPGVEWVRFNLEDPASFGSALNGAGSIFLMRPPQIAKTEAFQPFLQAAKSRGISRIVVLSVAGAESNHFLPHHGMEKLVQELGFAWTMIRPSDFMQNLETVHLESIRDRNEIAVPAGKGCSAFIDVSDIGEVIGRVLLEDGHAEKGYTLTGPEALSFDQVAEALTEALGRPIRYRKVGVPRFLIEQRARRQPLGLSLVMTALYTVQRVGKASTVTNTVSELLGRPPHTLRDYLTRESAIWTKR